jgi:hypothetical protein
MTKRRMMSMKMALMMVTMEKMKKGTTPMKRRVR